MGEDWIGGPAPVLRNLQLLERTLGTSSTPAPAAAGLEVAPNGQVVAKVFPTDWLDNLLFPGFTGEVRLQPGVTLDEAENAWAASTAGARPTRASRSCSAPATCRRSGRWTRSTSCSPRTGSCLLKMNPVNEHLGPHIAEAFEALVREGFLRIVYGGAEVGAYLTEHDGVDEIHITGSDKTHDAIVFGTGEEGAPQGRRRPEADQADHLRARQRHAGHRRARAVVGRATSPSTATTSPRCWSTTAASTASPPA
jgi:hypothetical protein